jgi:hypothetical protein
MADRTLVTNFILDAQAAQPNDIAAQILWLNTERRVPLSAKVTAGDIEITSRTLEGNSTSSQRHISNRDLLDAVLAAIEQLTADLAGTANRRRSGIITPRFGGIIN